MRERTHFGAIKKIKIEKLQDENVKKIHMDILELILYLTYIYQVINRVIQTNLNQNKTKIEGR